MTEIQQLRAECGALRDALQRSKQQQTHCEGCGYTWLDDGLNPIGCPYCELPVENALTGWGLHD